MHFLQGGILIHYYNMSNNFKVLCISHLLSSQFSLLPLLLHSYQNSYSSLSLLFYSHTLQASFIDFYCTYIWLCLVWAKQVNKIYWVTIRIRKCWPILHTTIPKALSFHLEKEEKLWFGPFHMHFNVLYFSRSLLTLTTCLDGKWSFEGAISHLVSLTHSPFQDK